MTLRPVGEFYDDAGMEWSLRSVGPHLHPGSEESTVVLAGCAARYGMETGGRILDVASALGAPARFIARRFGARIICVDMDPRMHAAARARNAYEGVDRLVQPVRARAERLPLADRSCDGAWSQDALCHTEKDAVLGEVARVLKPGTVFAFSDFIARPSFTREDLESLRDWAFPSLFTIPRYVAAMDALGFEVLLAEDRTGTVIDNRPVGMVDDELWWHDFSERWGAEKAAEIARVGRAWQSLVTAGRSGYGMFVARRNA